MRLWRGCCRTAPPRPKPPVRWWPMCSRVTAASGASSTAAPSSRARWPNASRSAPASRRTTCTRLIAGVPAELAPIEGTVALLRRLHADGRALYYLSNMPEPFAQHLERSHDVPGAVPAAGCSRRASISSSPSARSSTTRPRAFGIDPAQTLFIDDYEANVAAARAAGWQALHFQSPAQCEAELVTRGLL